MNPINHLYRDGHESVINSIGQEAYELYETAEQEIGRIKNKIFDLIQKTLNSAKTKMITSGALITSTIGCGREQSYNEKMNEIWRVQEKVGRVPLEDDKIAYALNYISNNIGYGILGIIGQGAILKIYHDCGAIGKTGIFVFDDKLFSLGLGTGIQTSAWLLGAGYGSIPIALATVLAFRGVLVAKKQIIEKFFPQKT